MHSIYDSHTAISIPRFFACLQILHVPVSLLGFLHRQSAPNAAWSVPQHSTLTTLSLQHGLSLWPVSYTEKATKARHRHGRGKNNKAVNSYNQPKLASSGTTHGSHTGINRKINPRALVKSQNAPAQKLCTHVKYT